MANNKFKAAVRKAKGLYKTGRYKTFADAVKAAYKKVGSVKRKPAAKKKAAKPRRVTVKKSRTKTVTVSGGSIGKVSASSLKGELSRRYKTSLASLLLRRDLSAKKTVKRKLTKQIREVKSNLNKIS